MTGEVTLWREVVRGEMRVILLAALVIGAASRFGRALTTTTRSAAGASAEDGLRRLSVVDVKAFDRFTATLERGAVSDKKCPAPRKPAAPPAPDNGLRRLSVVDTPAFDRFTASLVRSARSAPSAASKKTAAKEAQTYDMECDYDMACFDRFTVIPERGTAQQPGPVARLRKRVACWVTEEEVDSLSMME